MKITEVKNNVENKVRSILHGVGRFPCSTGSQEKVLHHRGATLTNQKGITLIALVITIIILLILSGIVISLTIGEHGILNMAKQAGKNYLTAAEQEQAELDELYAYINGETLPENTEETDAGTLVAVPDKWKTSTPAYVRTSDGEEVISSKRISTVQAVATGDRETIPVPLGFYYVGGKIETGVVISDNSQDKYDGKTDKTSHEYASNLKGNQFVWIPCKLEDYHKINWGKENAKWDTTTNALEYDQIEKYEGFYIGRYEAGVGTLNNEKKEKGENDPFDYSVTFKIMHHYLIK